MSQAVCQTASPRRRGSGELALGFARHVPGGALLACLTLGIALGACARHPVQPGPATPSSAPAAAPASAPALVSPSMSVPNMPGALSPAPAPPAASQPASARAADPTPRPPAWPEGVSASGAGAAEAGAAGAGSQAGAIVVVNGEGITEDEFALGYAAYLQSLGSPPDTPELRMAYLDSLVTGRLLEQEARRRGLAGDPGYNLRVAQAKRQAIEETLLMRALARQLDVSDPEVAAYYESHKDQYVQPEAIQVRNITTYTREAAEQARQRILNGEDFRAVASQVSIHPSRAEGGALPPFSRGAYNPQFENVAFSLKIGELSNVFQTDLGYHVIEKTGATPGRAIPLSQVREEIRALLGQQKRRAALDELNRALRESADIRVLRNP